MQPYFFPYLGYWQLINAVDKFVIYDDVNFIKGGWINRNRILGRGEPLRINLQLHQASSNKLINQVELLGNRAYIAKQLKTLQACYRKAPCYQEVYPVLEGILTQPEANLARYLLGLIRQVCEYLGIGTELLVSSSLAKNNALRGQAKVLEICRILGADWYINAIGGKVLYARQDFATRGIKLSFLSSKASSYPQFNHAFVPQLSIIDVLMFNSRSEVKSRLEDYDLT